MHCALVLLVFLSTPEAADTPQAALDRLAESIRKGELVAAYDQLGANGRALLDKELARVARAVGADPVTAVPREVVKAFEGRLQTETGRQMLREFGIRVLKATEGEDRASLQVEVTMSGRKDRVVLLLARIDGRWRLDGVDTSEVQSKTNETAAIATLRNILSAQAQFQASARADVDADGNGEYGFFGELSGAVEVRGGKKLNPPVLSVAFRAVEKGVVTRSGYHFRIFLCDKDGNAIGEEKGTGDVDAGKAETVWCCYAWPVEYGKTGTRTFFVNQFGDVLAADHKGYSGANGPAADAAFRPGATKGRITGEAAIDAAGNDGNSWKPVR